MSQSSIPSMESLRLSIPSNLFIRNEPRFLISVFYSMSFSLMILYIASKLIPLSLFYLPIWICYAFIAGTIWTGVWVLGHECGHGAFSSTQWKNDFLGFILHTILLVPYFSWQHSHAIHHSRTNHLTEGETHVPDVITKESGKKIMSFRDKIGVDAWAIWQMSLVFLIGWIAYIFIGSTGSPKRGFTSHFFVPNELFPRKKIPIVILSNIGLLFMLYFLYLWIQQSSFLNVLALYGGPYMVTNAWLAGYTWLQHTDADVPHYDEDECNWLKGALATIDRNYPEFINALHFDIGSTHVVHHLFSQLPHYNAREASTYLSKKLGKLYNWDPKPVWESLWEVSKLGVVEKKEKGVWKYIGKYPYFS